MEGKEMIIERIYKSLDMSKIDKKEEYYQIELPIITLFNHQIITLRIYPLDDGYYISNDGYTFDEYFEYNESYCEKYYNLFIKNEKRYLYDIKQDGAYIYKKYEANFAPRCAIDEFVRFFIYLDEFMLAYYAKENNSDEEK